MPTPITAGDVMRGLADALATACAARVAGTATLQSASGIQGQGWLIAVPASGAIDGRISVWFERTSAQAFGRAALKLEADPADDRMASLLRELVTEVVAAIEMTPAAAGMTTGAPAITIEPMPAAARPHGIALPDGLTCHIAVLADFQKPAASAGKSDTRLEAVLDVDLPLVVRFGRAVMPLRALADLGPGSVVDMGRSPDDPVELLVGERLIARGEVVIVGGNYGVRITELASGGQPPIELEARTS